MTGNRRCPEPEVLAAFVAGNLVGAELEDTAAHVCSCVDCLFLTATVGKVERNEVPDLQQPAAPRRAARRPWWIAVAAAAMVGIVFVPVWAVRSRSHTEPMRMLVTAATSLVHRNLEPRLGGFPWAPLADVTRGEEPLDPDAMKLLGAAGSVLERTQDDASPDARHAAALAHLLAGRTKEAAALLEKLATAMEDAGVWSDLAAVTYTDAMERGGEPARLARALHYANRALALDEHRPEALFNRALILEQLDMDGEARDAWKLYLSAESESAWQPEAREHLARLTAPQSERTNAPARDLYVAAEDAASRERWADALNLLRLALAHPAGNDAAVNILVTRALIQMRLGSPALAEADLALADSFMTRTNDSTLRNRATIARLQLESSLAPSPDAVVRLLRGTLESLDALGGPVAPLCLERGRAFAALGDSDSAFADLERGLRHGRKPAWDTEITRHELFNEAVTLALAGGNAHRAFGYAERARGGDSNIAAALRADGQLLIEYKVLPSQLVVFVVSDERVSAVQMPVRSGTLTDEVEELTARAAMGDTVHFRASAARLYARLIAPVANTLDPGRKLIIVPDSSLHGVPFAALVSPEGRYLIEDHAIVVTQSATQYAHLTAQRSVARTPYALVMAGPSSVDSFGRLFSAQREATAVAAEYAHVQRIPFDSADFPERARRANVIHIAAHSVTGDQQPALVTLAANGKTGRLDAGRIAAMDLHGTELVVLASCGSALTESGDGAQMSLADAFLYAGASSVVGTLWPIDDAAAGAFFPRLHAHVAQGASPADALRATQLECIVRRDTPPAMWAAVQLIGS